MDEKEKAQMIAEALSGLTYSEWQAVRSVIDAIFGKRAEKTLDALSLANTDIGHFVTTPVGNLTVLTGVFA